MKSRNIEPGYLQIRRYVYSLIAAANQENMNCKLTTEQELCEIFSMSPGTVRKALAALVEEGLLLRRPRHGTFINPAVLRLNHHDRYIGIITSDGNTTFFDPFVMAELSGIYDYLAERNFLSQMINFSGVPEKTLQASALDKSAGILWLQPRKELYEVAGMMQKKMNLRVVLVNPEFRSDEFDCVEIDYFQYGYAVAKKLLEKNHAGMLFLDSNSPVEHLPKREGARAALREAGIPWEDGFFRTGTAMQLLDLLGEELKNGPAFTAIECNGALYHSVREKLLECNSPVKLVAKREDDLTMPLHEISAQSSPQELGKAAAKLLLESSRVGGRKPVTVKLSVKIKER